jgi:hypothetical protein
VLKVLNVAAVGWALASVTGAVFAHIFNDGRVLALVTSLPTWVVGTMWAALLRWPRTFGKTSFRLGWAASVPLALVNSTVAGALAMGLERDFVFRPSQFLMGAALGATVGAIFWIPALALTMICFGLPIASAQNHAKKGLAGEERGERIVGLACLAMSIVGMALSWSSLPEPQSALWLPRVLGILGALAGGAAAVLARAREGRRRAFVSRAEAGDVPGYRVEPTEEGKVLIRVVSQGEGYRVADFEEEVFELDATGEATRPRVMRV